MLYACVSRVAARLSAARLPLLLQFLEGLSGWRRRWTIVLLCFFAFMLCNMDRVNMSIAVLPMSQQYGWSSQTVGLVQSSFFWWEMGWGLAGQRGGGRGQQLWQHLGRGLCWCLGRTAWLVHF